MIFNRLYILILIFTLAVCTSNLYATHNRAGEITYVQISELTFEITVTTYTYTLSNVDRTELEVEWGDGTFTTVPRYELLTLPDYYQRNRYVARHTFPGPGIYVILVQDPNRNYGVENIPNSVNTVFSVKTTLFVNPDFGTNNAPVLLNPPINQAAQYKTFLHNPGAFDYEGDSLVYSLTNCTGEDGEDIVGYSLPPATKSIVINSITGDLVWETPPDVGGFNLAIQIEEWRNGIKIGAITRDMQIDVFATENNPPEIDSIGEICVLVGDTANVLIKSTDLDLNSIELSATGGPFLFETSPATFQEVSSIPGEAVSKFTWITHCNHIRKEPYTVLINAKDDHPEVNLVDVERLLVKVIGPEPFGLITEPGNAFIRLNWNAPIDCVPDKYLIYRRVGSLNYVHDSCTTGLPDNSGYEFVGESEDTAHIDNDNGEGLVQGFDYCYRIIAEYADGAQSFPSDEQCTSLALGFPNITNVSVESTDLTNGKIMVRWAKPTRLDTIPGAIGPFKYIIYRSDDQYGMRLERIDSLETLEDTSFLDSGLNTTGTQYSYEIALYNVTPGNRFRIGIPQLASSIFLELLPSDNQVEINILKNTPWFDNEYVIYRFNNSTAEFDSIAYSTDRTFTDTKLKNGVNYCYKVKSIGSYVIDTVETSTINWSHENCQTPEDFQRPCPPALNVVSDCDNLKNILTWNNPNLTCANDVIAYKVYFVQNTEMSLDSIIRIEGAEITSFEHFPAESMGGCYAVAAIDSFNNESDASYVQCVDDCSYYELPNVFSPNGDGVNDVYFATNPLEYVKKLEMNIYNRWGELVYHTTDPLINWDGKAQNTNSPVAAGVYYYICDVWEPRISGLELRNIVGFIHVYTGTAIGEISNE
ncbi:MAG: gliding motility-associated C-terminal domain-containing protein [Bacteroidales bacterium]|jgi:gliding motility-associated-like protein|nr:gliding motility-associated C-terminal domain-containing protein [Bacteroidales bacterium]